MTSTPVGCSAGAATNDWKKGRHSSKSSVLAVTSSGSGRAVYVLICRSVPCAAMAECGVRNTAEERRRVIPWESSNVPRAPPLTGRE